MLVNTQHKSQTGVVFGTKLSVNFQPVFTKQLLRWELNPQLWQSVALSDISIAVTLDCQARGGSAVGCYSIIGATSVNVSVFSLKIILLIGSQVSPSGDFLS